MSQGPTVGELFKAKTVLDEQVEAAVDAVLADGYVLDLPAAMKAHAPTAKALADTNAGEKHRRVMVRTGILLARVATA